MLNTALVFASEASGHESGGMNPYAVGAIALVILLVLLFLVVAFGGGREHS
jgi:hypothetical protein